MSEIYNPYNFVPVAKRSAAQKKHDLPRDQGPSKGHVTHERFVAGTHSGRIICRITTKTPLVAGGEQKRPDGDYAIVRPYQAGDGRPAIPGSALRGMVAALAETASNSSLRILDNQPYSFRKPFEKHTLSALGMIVQDNDGLKLKPLVLPTLERSHDRRDFVVPPRFRKIFPKRPYLKVYFGDKASIRRPNFQDSSATPEQHAKWTVRLLDYNARGGIDPIPGVLHCKDKGRQVPEHFLVSQNPEGGVPERLGYMRVLGCWGDRESQIPEGKKHELWLPDPGSDVPLLPLDEKVVDRFHSLADERTEASIKARDALLPFHPLPTKRNTDPKLGKKFRLKPGDMVYFDVTESGAVSEISLSAIWRGQVKAKDGGPAGAHAFFSAVDPDLVPFRRDRTNITIAEQMFGFVEDLDPERKNAARKIPENRPALALASRIRFADALLPKGVTRDQALEPKMVPLKILGSPKPPSPAMYFRPRGRQGWVAKTDLSPDLHDPQGRKFYLHHKVDPNTEPWRTAPIHENDSTKNQKNKVRPVRAGQTFWFHIDFDNLSDTELGLLLYALAPTGNFHHKLGMGKPLGLGSIRLEVAAVAMVDRQTRYSLAGLRSERWSSVVLAPGSGEFQWDGSYEPIARLGTEGKLFDLRDKIIGDLVSADTHRAISVLGDFSAAPPARLIGTPMLADQQDPEEETFRFFVANDGGLKDRFQEYGPVHQALPPVTDRVRPLQRPVPGPRQGRGR